MGGVEASLTAMLAPLPKSKRLKTLSLSDVGGAGALPSTVGQLSPVTDLTIHTGGLTDRVIIHYVGLVFGSLTRVDVRRCPNLGNGGLRQLCQLKLLTSLTMDVHSDVVYPLSVIVDYPLGNQLKRLSVQGYDFDQLFSPATLDRIVDLTPNTTIKHLDLQHLTRYPHRVSPNWKVIFQTLFFMFANTAVLNLTHHWSGAPQILELPNNRVGTIQTCACDQAQFLTSKHGTCRYKTSRCAATYANSSSDD